MNLKIENLASMVGSSLVDEYGRDVGTLVSIVSNVDGYVQHVEVKIVDRGIERIPGERVKLRDGKIVVVPEWKFNAMKVIEGLDRAYRRRKALENIAGSGDIPGEVVDAMKRKLSDEIKKLKIDADRIKKEVKERGYTQGMNHLRKLKEALSAEKSDAKSTLDRLEKTLEIASSPLPKEQAEKPKYEEKPVTAPSSQGESLVIKIEE